MPATTLAIYLTREEEVKAKKKHNRKHPESKIKGRARSAPDQLADTDVGFASLVELFPTTSPSSSAASSLLSLSTDGSALVNANDTVRRSTAPGSAGEAEILICVYAGKNNVLYFGGPGIALALHLDKQNRAKMNEVLKSAGVPAHADNFGKMFTRKPQAPLQCRIEAVTWKLTFDEKQKFTSPQTTWGLAFGATHQLIVKRKESTEKHISQAASDLEQKLLVFPPYSAWYVL